MTRPDSKYVAASRPVNRRTAAKTASRPDPVNPLLQSRLAASKARQRVGPPLAGQVKPAGRSGPQFAPGPLSIGGGVLAAASSIGLFLAWSGQSLALAMGGVAGLGAGLLLLARGRKTGAVQADVNTAQPALFDEASLQALDRVIAEIAPEVNETVIVGLTGIKQQIARIAQHTRAAASNGDVTVEDRLYMTECVRRYLPDSLQSYLQVPRAQRDSQVMGEQGQTALSLLLGQLALLGKELAKREIKLSRSTAEQLLKQQRFLEAKSRQ